MAMKVEGLFGRRYVAASLSAGPVLVCSTALAAAYLTIPQVIAPEIRVAELAWLPWMLLLISFVGALIAFPVNAVGSCLLAALAAGLPFLRLPTAWVLVGGAIGAAIALLFGDAPTELTFGLTAASAFSAWMCHRDLTWQADA